MKLVQHITMQSIANTICNTSNSNFIGIFLYGSQNYGLSTHESDMDTIMLVRNANSSSEEQNHVQGKIKIYTLKYFLYRLQKGDLECLEILYTKHRYINPLYIQDFELFISDFSQVLSHERVKYALYLKLDEHINHIFWSARKSGDHYNKKRLYWAMRVQNQLERIDSGESFESSLEYKSKLQYDLLAIKQNSNHLSLKQLNEIYRILTNYLVQLPRWNNTILPEEEKVCSNFYSKFNKELKSFEY